MIALAYDIGTERMVEQRDSPRTFWTGSALFTRWHIAGPWAIAVRPEVYWDRNERLTGSEQFIRSVTSTLEYKVPFSETNTILRLEHRYDHSTGQQGGFFKGGEISPGVIGLVPEQHLVIFAAMWTFDSP